MSWNGQAPDIVSVCFVMKWSSPKNSISHDKTDWYYVWGLTISWQNRMILCLGIDHFMTTQTDTMSGAWPFLKWSIPRHSISLFCHEMVKTHAWYRCVLSWNNQALWMVSVCFVFHDKTHWYHAWDLTISWQNTLIPCMGLDHFMTKHTDTMHGTWPFHDKADWYYAWDLTISSHAWYQCVLSWNGQAPCMVSVCFVMKWSSPRHSISVFCHEIGNPQT
jgi:hypothetical protein